MALNGKYLRLKENGWVLEHSSGGTSESYVHAGTIYVGDWGEQLEFAAPSAQNPDWIIHCEISTDLETWADHDWNGELPENFHYTDVWIPIFAEGQKYLGLVSRKAIKTG